MSTFKEFKPPKDLHTPKTVKESAVYLDRLMPDWHMKINITFLDIGSFKDCILGQLYDGKFINGILAFYGVDAYPGFTFRDDDYVKEWRHEILLRLVTT